MTRWIVVATRIALVLLMAAGPIGAQGSSAPEEYSDSQIKTAVIGEFFWDPRVDAEEIDVIVEDRLVVLTGTVSSLSEVAAAEEIVEQVQGVRSVANNLVVYSGEVPEPADFLIVRRVEQVLDVLTGLGVDDIAIQSPEEGVVLLEGTVDSFDDKRRAVEAASNVVGVREVADNIAVVPTKAFSDEVIAENVVEAIRRTTTVDLDDVDVFVSGGDVRLEGSMGTWNDVLAVLDAASYTLGVTDVVNNLTVEESDPLARRTDSELRRAVQDQLVWDDRVDASTIRVSVDDGFVTLTGEVDNVPESRAAVSDARAVAGVRQVFNHLEVVIGEESAELPDPTEEAIVNALRWTEAVDASSVAVIYRDGTVLLEGNVPSMWEKARLEQLVADIRGVGEVDNRLAVVPTDQVSDERIANRIINALTERLFLDAEDITVMVEDGVVLLTGTVDSAVERRMAYNIALQTEGVVGIEQEITVES